MIGHFMKMVSHKMIAISSHCACAVNFYHMSGHYGGATYTLIDQFQKLPGKWLLLLALGICMLSFKVFDWFGLGWVGLLLLT